MLIFRLFWLIWIFLGLLILGNISMLVVEVWMCFWDFVVGICWMWCILFLYFRCV